MSIEQPDPCPRHMCIVPGAARSHKSKLVLKACWAQQTLLRLQRLFSFLPPRPENEAGQGRPLQG